MRRTKLRPTIANPLHREVRSSSPEAQKLRELAAWYRDFAERAGSAVIWESRLRMAEDLNREADQLFRWTQTASTFDPGTPHCIPQAERASLRRTTK
jgi:hypothetical protein